MKIKIDKVVDHGTLNSERVQISVLQDVELGDFIVADTTYTISTRVSNKLRHMHWFNDQRVKAGDKVELYTKSGTNSKVDIGSGNTKYTIHWGLNKCVWNNEGDAAVLFYAPTWNATKVNEAD